MDSRRFRARMGTRVGSSAAALALICLVTLSFSLGGARSAGAAVGDCNPGANWGTLSTSFAAQVLTLVNEHRTGMGLSPLTMSPTLTASAQWKSLHMAYYGYMDHDDPAPPVARSWVDRIEACGYTRFTTAGENIAEGYQTPQDVMTGWLNSPGHRANIESASYAAIGIGAAQAANGTWYWTQDFGSTIDAGGGAGATAPAVTLTSTPPSSTTATNASFTWSTTGSPTATTCSLDGSAPEACTSPAGYSGLATGGQSFTVTVSNSAGSNSATFSWTVTASVSKPTVSFTSTPASSTTATSATFVWTATGSPTSTTCSLDGAAPTACASPTSLSGLAAGGHTFVVAVGNSAGTGSATYNWAVSAKAAKVPTVSFTRVPAAGATKAKFAWSATRAPTSVTCSLDGAPAAPCTSPTVLTVARGSTHTFVVTVANASGSNSAQYSW